MLKAPWVLLVWVPLAFAVLIAAIVERSGRWPLVASVFAGMAVVLMVLGVLIGHLPTPRGEMRLSGGPTRRQVRRRTAILHARHPSAHPADLATRVRAWYGGGTVNRFNSRSPGGCLVSLILSPVWLVRDALVAPTREEFEQAVTDAVAEVTGKPPSAWQGW